MAAGWTGRKGSIRVWKGDGREGEGTKEGGIIIGRGGCVQGLKGEGTEKGCALSKVKGNSFNGTKWMAQLCCL